MRWSQETYLLSPKLISKLKHAFNDYGGGFADFEDFYHDYIIHILESKGLHQTIDQYAIDWYRKFVGRTGKKKTLAYAVSDEEYLAKLQAEETHLNLPYIQYVKSLLDKYKGRSRAVIMLYYVYSYDQDEIGLLFNVSASRICQILKRIKEGGADWGNGDEFENPELQNEINSLKKKLTKVYRKHIEEKIL